MKNSPNRAHKKSKIVAKKTYPRSSISCISLSEDKIYYMLLQKLSKHSILATQQQREQIRDIIALIYLR